QRQAGVGDPAPDLRAAPTGADPRAAPVRRWYQSRHHVYFMAVTPLSAWHASLADGDDLPARPPLPGDRDADVAIVGAGFTGLWTAHSLLRADPHLRVVVLEREVAGFGASGRNGGGGVGGHGAPRAGRRD